MADWIDRNVAIRKFIEGDGDDEFTTGYNCAVDEYRQKLSEIPSVNNWISCNEKFPEDGQDVIIYIAERWKETPIQIAHIQHDKVLIKIAHIHHDDFLWELSDGEFYFSKDEVTHWMPLPEKPETTSDSMNEIKLKPCPFCGSEVAPEILTLAEIYCHDNCDATDFGVVCNYRCGGCGASTGGRCETEEEAAEAWNRRTDNG